MSGLWQAAVLVLAVLVLVEGVALISVMRNVGVLAEAVRNGHQAPASPTSKLTDGAALPALDLQTPAGEPVSTTTWRGARTAFVVTGPGCPACHGLLGSIAAANDATDPLNHNVEQTIIVSTGDRTATAQLLAELHVPQTMPVVIDTHDAVAQTWGITAIPTTVVTDADHTVVQQIVGFVDHQPQSAAHAVGG